MKRRFTFLMAFFAMLLCTSSAWAETLYFAFGGGTVSDALGGGKEQTWTSNEHAGYSWAITGNTAKAISGGNKVNATPYYDGYLTGFKNSNGAQNTFYMPEGVKISNIKFIGYTNKDKANGKTCTLQEINGVTVTENNTLDVYTDDVVNKQVENPGVIDYTFPEPVSGSFTFKMGNQQGCFIIVIETVEEETPVEPETPAGPVVFTMVQNEADLVAGGKYLIMAEVDGGWVALSDVQSTYRHASDTLAVSAEYTVSVEVATAVAESPAKFAGAPYALTLEGEAGAWKFKDELSGAYLHWKSSNSVINDAAGSTWTIAFNNYAHNAVIAHATTTDRKLQYNASNPRFACYTSSQKPVYLFKAGEVTVAPVAPVELSFNSIAELLAFDGVDVEVDLVLNNAKITYRKGSNMSITDGADTIDIFDYNIPSEYKAGGIVTGTISGILGLYYENKQITNLNLSGVTNYVAPVEVESPWVGAVFEAGKTYYLYNAKAKAFMDAGLDWGTKAVFSDHGWAVTPEGTDTYTLKMFNSNYYSKGDFVDGNANQAAKFTFTEVGDKVYTIKVGDKFYGGQEDNEAVIVDIAAVDDRCYWQLVTEDERKAAMQDANAYNGVYAGFYFCSSGFARNGNNGGWTGFTGYNTNGNATHVVEFYNSPEWGIKHNTITGLPNGVYEVKIDAFYRYGNYDVADKARQNGTEELLALLYANNDTVPVMSILDGAGKLGNLGANTTYGNVPDTKAEAETYFKQGIYTNSLFVTVTDGTLTVGVLKKNKGVDRDWFAMDNASLVYYGDATLEEIEMAILETRANEVWEVLSEAMSMERNCSEAAASQLDEAIATGEAATKYPYTHEALDKAEELLVAAIARVTKSNSINAWVADVTELPAVATQFVVNPDMETGNIKGWTTTASWQFQNNNQFTNGEAVINNKFQERWNNGVGLGNTSTMQTLVDMPNGVYRVTASIIATAQYKAAEEKKSSVVGAYWYANNDSVAIATEDAKPELFTVETTVVDNTLTIGIVGVNTTANWLAFDNVVLSLVELAPSQDPVALTPANSAAVETFDSLVIAYGANVSFNELCKESIVVLDANGKVCATVGKDACSVVADTAVVVRFTPSTESMAYIVTVPEGFFLLNNTYPTHAVETAVMVAAWIDVAAERMTNPDFASIEGWTVEVDHVGESYGGTYYKLDAATDPSTIEVYHTWSAGSSSALDQTKNFKISQKVMLPAGEYRLKVNGFYREGAQQNETTEKAWIFVGEEKQSIMGIGTCGANSMADAAAVFKNGGCLNEMNFTIAEDGEVEIGFQGYINTSLSWVILGPMQLEKLYTLKDRFKEVYSNLEMLSNTCSSMYSLQGVYNKWLALQSQGWNIVGDIDNASVSEMATLISEMETLIADVKNIDKFYTGTYMPEVALCDEVMANSVADAEVVAAYDAVLALAGWQGMSAVSTVADLQAIIDTLVKARNEYVLNAVPVEDYAFDYTFLLASPDCASKTGWTTVGTVGTMSNQHWSGQTNTYLEPCDWGATGWEASISQVLTLPNGVYTVKATGRASAGVTLTLQANDSIVTIPSTGDVGGTIATDGTEWADVAAGIAAGKTFANNNAGRGWSYATVKAIVADSTLTITAKGTTAEVHQWASVDDFQLFYHGPAPVVKGPKVAYLCGATETTEAIYNALVAANYDVTALNYDDVSLTEEIVANDFVGKYDVVVLAGSTGSKTNLAATYTALLGKVPVLSTKSFWYVKTTPAGTNGDNPGTADNPSRFLVKTVAEHPIFGGIAGDTITVFNDMAKEKGRYLQQNGTFANNEPAQTTLGTANGADCIGEAWVGDMGWLIIPVDGAQPEGYLTEAGKALFVNAVAYLVAGEKYEAPVVEVATVTLNKVEAELTEAGATVQLTATVAPENATDKAITWTSSDEKVATVDANGLVTAVANGTATITATAANGVKAECVITVKIAVVDGIEAIEAVENAVIYTITGKAVQGDVKTLERGIYIINGKKVLVK